MSTNNIHYKPEIKAAFIAALRSGEYQQTTHKLKDGKGCFCAEGVLADLYAKAHGLEWESNNISPMPEMNSYGLPSCGTLWISDPKVWEWATGQQGEPSFDYNGSNEIRLMSLNDCFGLSFAEIADIVEAQG